jgi:S-DNA-T family DNA segregation ATPase FtsK/SpoIIIE
LFAKSETPRAVVLETEPEQPPKETKEKLWEYPPLDLLSDAQEIASSGNISKNIEIIQKTLANFGIEVTMSDVNIGPTVTQYTFKPAEGIKLSQITARQNDLALALAAKSLRMEAPVPGKSVVGIEIPNKVPAKVTLKQVIDTKEFKSAKGNLVMAVGLDVAGTPVVLDLEKMPHLLIAGQTGSGKSVAINSIIVTFLFRNSPDELRFILVDPKRVELTNYNGIPHLLTPVITETSKTVAALKWLVAEMDRRYRLFSEHGKRNIQVYNSSPPDGKKLNYIVCIIDELADLMAASSKEVEGSIVRLAQLARATGIHLVLATQRPSVDVITGLIKANIPMRMAFAVASQVDSRTIIDQAGAEKLLGNGDMLIVGNEITKPRRVQGTFVSDKEIEAVINFWKEKSVAQYDETITEFKPQGGLAGSVGSDHAEEDELYDQAVEVVMQAGKASASLLQRRLKIGYARAARLLDLLEEDGIIGPADGAKPRDVLVSKDQIEL